MKLLTTILILLPFMLVNAQDSTLKGRIINEDLEVLPDVKILNENNEMLGITDIEGNFVISISKENVKLNICCIGMEPTIIELTDNCDNLDIILMIESHYDFMSLKKVDRLRMKRFKKLPELRKEAFDKGIFISDKVCYKQEFTPYRKKE